MLSSAYKNKNFTVETILDLLFQPSNNILEIKLYLMSHITIISKLTGKVIITKDTSYRKNFKIQTPVQIWHNYASN